MEEQTLMRREDVALTLKRAGVPVGLRTLERWARQGIGPRPIKVGPRFVRYRRSDVEAWLKECA